VQLPGAGADPVNPTFTLGRSPVLAGRGAAQADYEALRAHVLTTGAMPDSLTACACREPCHRR
jgi:hypothetical protein